jgi:hypothetical protein
MSEQLSQMEYVVPAPLPATIWGALVEMLLHIFIEFLVPLFGLYVIGLSYLDAIYSSALLICMFRLPVIFVIMIYQLFIRSI